MHRKLFYFGRTKISNSHLGATGKLHLKINFSIHSLSKLSLLNTYVLFTFDKHYLIYYISHYFHRKRFTRVLFRLMRGQVRWNPMFDGRLDFKLFSKSIQASFGAKVKVSQTVHIYNVVNN